MNIEQPEENIDDGPEAGFYNFEEIHQTQLGKLKDRVAMVARVYDSILGISKWNDSVNTDDRQVIEKKGEIIQAELPEILADLDRQFHILENDINEAGEVKSESGRLYQPKEVIMNIYDIKNSVELSSETLPGLVKRITRTNDYRNRASELLDLFLKVRDIKI